MPDHNEAMRLADALAQPGVRYATETEAQAKLRRIKNQAEAAALIRQQAERIAELELQPAFAQLASDLAVKLADTEAERDTLRAELETERMRLVACGVVAMANTAESAAKARDMHPDYLCASVRDVAAAVDREMALRAEVERLNLAEEGAAQAFGDVVQQKRDLEGEVKRLQSLLDGAYASIRNYSDTARKATQ